MLLVKILHRRQVFCYNRFISLFLCSYHNNQQLVSVNFSVLGGSRAESLSQKGAAQLISSAGFASNQTNTALWYSIYFANLGSKISTSVDREKASELQLILTIFAVIFVLVDYLQCNRHSGSSRASNNWSLECNLFCSLRIFCGKRKDSSHISRAADGNVFLLMIFLSLAGGCEGIRCFGL